MLFIARVISLTFVIATSKALSPSDGKLDIQNLAELPNVNIFSVGKDHSSIDSVPNQVNWIDKGYVTSVKNQGNCESGWAFSAVGAVEGQHFKHTGKLITLSAQQLVDCSREFFNDGCEDGLPQHAFQYIIAHHGIDSEASYPYTAKDGNCHFTEQGIAARLSRYVNVSSGDEIALKEAVATIGPISAMIDASHNSFLTYDGGIYVESACRPSNVHHGVLIVGYGTVNGQDFWIVKNSFGTAWGIRGYILMARNSFNHCGIATAASYPLVQ